MAKNSLQHYLSRYAEEVSLTTISSVPDTRRYNHCLVIPAYNENARFLEQLQSHHICQQKLLIILVINQPDNDQHTDTNQRLWQQASISGTLINSDKSSILLQWPNTHTDLLVIDRFSPAKKLPKKHGVGLARKIGCDIACGLIARGQLHTSWIHTTDADSRLPRDYLDTLPQDLAISAIVYPFQHCGPASALTEATLMYEKSLHYYVAGLAFAGSPYAYHTLGSCLAVNANHYAQARGFPKRAGGEDFYLLNKLAKLGEIQQRNSLPIMIEARHSHRAPFGTGAAVNKILQGDEDLLSLTVYHPRCFLELKQLLAFMEHLFDYQSEPNQWLDLLSVETQSVLQAMSIDSLLSHLTQHKKTKAHWLTQSHYWFDAFRTLKFIHHMERYYAKQPIEIAFKELSAMVHSPKGYDQAISADHPA